MSLLKRIKAVKRDLDFWWFYKNFYRKFRFYTSEDRKELEELYKIRNSVYCEEYKYIDPQNTHDGLEYDDWDAHSIHFIIRNGDNKIAATVRLILNSKLSFPIEKHFKFDVDVNHYNKDKIAEISRLIVAKKYRKHHLMFVLIKGMYLFVKRNGISNVYSVMDDKLYPLLVKMGLPFRKIGKPSLYQGFTYPCILNVKELEDFLRANNPRLFNYLTEGVIDYNHLQNTYTLS